MYVNEIWKFFDSNLVLLVQVNQCFKLEVFSINLFALGFENFNIDWKGYKHLFLFIDVIVKQIYLNYIVTNYTLFFSVNYF
ncbi:Protein of unknown function [Gryllus bimaculatus]|nr:Protein of unknown function [Gryllus bimaculatus]